MKVYTYYAECLPKNQYLGDNTSNVEMKTAETYAYVEYQFKHKKLNYMVGLGGMRTYNEQDDVNNTKYIFRPSLRISYKISDNLFLRYNGYVSGYSPSLSNLNNVEQTIDSLQIRRGNPNLKTVVFYASSISISWNKGILGVELLAKYSYDHKPIMESLYYEDAKFIRTYENHKGFHRINVQTAFKSHPYKDIISIMVTPWFNRQISEGNNYIHTNNNWGVRGNISLSYNKWVFDLEMSTRNNELWGETLKRGERFHSIIAGYNTNNWSLWGGFLNPFSKKYDINTRNLSDIMPSKQYTYTKNLSQLFVIGFSLNLNLGRQYKSANKRLDNRDTDSGILSGSKE